MGDELKWCDSPLRVFGCCSHRQSPSLTHCSLPSQINLFVALAPVAYVNNQKSLVLSLMADLDLVTIFEIFGNKDFLPDASILQKLAPGLCHLLPGGCDVVLEALCGPVSGTNRE